MALHAEKEEMQESFSNLKNAEPELCIKLLQFPTVHNFFGIRKKIETSDAEWLEVFFYQYVHTYLQSFDYVLHFCKLTYFVSRK